MSEAKFIIYVVGAHNDRSGKTRTRQIVGSHQDDEHKSVDPALANLSFQAGVIDDRFDQFQDGQYLEVTLRPVEKPAQ